MTTINSRYKPVVRIILVTAVILSLPLIAMRFTNEVVWDLADFVVAGALLAGAGLTFELIVRNMSSLPYRVAGGVAVAAVVLLVWIELAVGIFD